MDGDVSKLEKVHFGINVIATERYHHNPFLSFHTPPPIMHVLLDGTATDCPFGLTMHVDCLEDIQDLGCVCLSRI